MAQSVELRFHPDAFRSVFGRTVLADGKEHSYQYDYVFGIEQYWIDGEVATTEQTKIIRREIGL
jgi:hypothetical protein